MPLSATIPETLAGGRYVLGPPLGEGGTALVVRATDTALNVERAVKLLVGGSSPEARASLRRRLQAEARTMARLRHPHVLTVHDVGEEGGVDYIVMDLAAGSVGDELERRGYLPADEAIDKGVQVLSALGAAHAAGVVHRDVKPWNLLLDPSGRVLLADFGVALVADEARRTRAGVAMGSYPYMPHEQRMDAAAVGPEADLYAVGATLYHLVTGDTPTDLFLHAGVPDHPRWSAVPPALRPIVQRACATKPEDRYPSAAAMIADLEAARTDTARLSAVVPVPTVPLAPDRSARGRRWAPIGLLAAGALLVAAVPLALRPPPAAPALAPANAPAAAPAPEPAPVPEPEPEPAPPEPAVAPAPPLPAPAAPRKPPAAPRGGPHPLLGAWSGSLNGVRFTLELAGTAEAVTGRASSRVGTRSESHPIVGRMVGGTALRLTEPDSDAVYSLALTEAGRLVGSVDLGGSTRQLVLQRSPP